VHLLINSRLSELIAVKDELIKAAKLAGHAEGLEQGTARGLQQAARTQARIEQQVSGHEAAPPPDSY
jgi:hypothetical protein